MDDTWNCVSLELNIDSIKHRLDYSYSLEIIEGLFLKAYKHGYVARLEIADRRKVSLLEVVQLFQALSGRIEGKEALRKADALEARVRWNEKDTHLALNIARKVRDSKQQTSTTTGTKKAKLPASPFRTGAEIKQERAGESPQTTCIGIPSVVKGGTSQ
jgi:hypothetical protein